MTLVQLEEMVTKYVLHRKVLNCVRVCCLQGMPGHPGPTGLKGKKVRKTSVYKCNVDKCVTYM